MFLMSEVPLYSKKANLVFEKGSIICFFQESFFFVKPQDRLGPRV